MAAASPATVPQGERQAFPGEAIQALEHAVQLDPKDPDALYNLSLAQVRSTCQSGCHDISTQELAGYGL